LTGRSGESYALARASRHHPRWAGALTYTIRHCAQRAPLALVPLSTDQVRLKDLEERPEGVGLPSGGGRFIGSNTCNATSPLYRPRCTSLWGWPRRLAKICRALQREVACSFEKPANASALDIFTMNSARETLYFLANPAMPGLLKIGHTSDSLESRLRQLNTTGVPQPFYVVASFTVRNAAECEKEIHDQIAHSRPNKNREFFEISPDQALLQAAPTIAKFLDTSGSAAQSPEPHSLDKDDIYFLQFILHDGQSHNQLMSTEELAEHHSGYAPLELEYKLLRLAEEGMIEQVHRGSEVRSYWKITPRGIKFMFEGRHILQDLLDEARKKDA